MWNWIKRKPGMVSPSRLYADAARVGAREWLDDLVFCEACDHIAEAHRNPCTACVRLGELSPPCMVDFGVTAERS